jgi:hypothetical protein
MPGDEEDTVWFRYDFFGRKFSTGGLIAGHQLRFYHWKFPRGQPSARAASNSE